MKAENVCAEKVGAGWYNEWEFLLIFAVPVRKIDNKKPNGIQRDLLTRLFIKNKQEDTTMIPALLPATLPVLEETMMVGAAYLMMNRKTLLPWLFGQEDNNGRGDNDKWLAKALEEKDREIQRLKRENAELKDKKVVYITQIDHVDTYVKKTDSVTNYVSITMKDEMMKMT